MNGRNYRKYNQEYKLKALEPLGRGEKREGADAVHGVGHLLGELEHVATGDVRRVRSRRWGLW
jgi:hypothetical protein